MDVGYKQSPFEILKKLAELAQRYYRKVSDKKYLSLLHIVAKVGEIDLFQFIVRKLDTLDKLDSMVI